MDAIGDGGSAILEDVPQQVERVYAAERLADGRVVLSESVTTRLAGATPIGIDGAEIGGSGSVGGGGTQERLCAFCPNIYKR